MDYPIMQLPFGEKDFMYYSRKETKEYFSWFMNEIPKRLDILKEFFLRFGENADIFDFSVESLDIIWKWYLEYVVVEDTDEETYQMQLDNTPEQLRSYVLKKQLGKGWTQTVVDIGIYFCSCLLAHCSQLKWGVKTEPSNLLTVNRPAVVGFFNDSFEPIQIMLVMGERVVKGNSQENALSTLFDRWISKEMESPS